VNADALPCLRRLREQEAQVDGAHGLQVPDDGLRVVVALELRHPQVLVVTGDGRAVVGEDHPVAPRQHQLRVREMAHHVSHRPLPGCLRRAQLRVGESGDGVAHAAADACEDGQRLLVSGQSGEGLHVFVDRGAVIGGEIGEG